VARPTVRLLAVAALLAWAAGPAAAQQNLFNVVSSEITPQGKVFFQQQFNQSLDLESNTTLAYGLGNGWEVGFNFFDVPLSRPRGVRENPLTGEPNLIPAYLGTAQKAWELSDTFLTSVGTQLGGGFERGPSKAPRNFTYWNWVYQEPDHGPRVIVGTYYSHLLYNNSDHFGMQLGVDVPVVPKKVHFVADYISGTDALSVGVVGGVIYLPRGWQVSLGAQLPSPGSRNDYGFVLELTRIPSD
jgi:hypothetical protein